MSEHAMTTGDELLTTTLQRLFGPRLGGWASAPARGRSVPERLAVVWWRGQLVLLLARLCWRRPRVDLADFVLALHLHGATLRDLAAVSGLDEERLSQLVLEARRRYSASWVSPCPDGADLVTRWRDLAAEPDSWRLLLAHSASCRSCRFALAACRLADERFAAGPLEHGVVARSRPGNRFVRALAVLAVLLLVLGLGYPLRREPAPALLDAVPPVSGPFVWLGSAGPYSLAFDLGRRQWMPVPVQFPVDAGSFRLLSPDDQLVATWTPDPPREPRWLDVLALDGTRIAHWRWDKTTTRRPLGWLDRVTLLVRETPSRLPYEREAEYLERLQQSSRLLAVSIPSGQETILAQELVSDAVPAPDGRTLALVRAMEPFGTGATSRAIELRTLGGAESAGTLARVDGYLGSIGEQPLWLPDSSGLVLARRPPGAPPTLPAPTELVLLERDGTIRTLFPARPDTIVRPLAIAPDGSRLLVVAIPIGQFERGDFYELNLRDGSQRAVFGLDRLAGPIAARWLGNEALLVVVRALPSAATDPSVSECTELYMLTGKTSVALGSAPGRWGFDAWGQSLLSVLPALPAGTRTPSSVPRGPADGPLLLAPGGRWLLAATRPGSLALWDAQSGIPLTESWQLTTPVWHPSGFGFYALGQDGQLVLTTRSLDGVWTPIRLVLPDREPVERDGIAIGPDGRVALWQRAADGSLTLRIGFLPALVTVERATVSPASGRACAVWRAAGRLLLAEPGAGDRLVLNEIVLAGDGSLREQPLTRVRPFVGRAVESCELAVDPRGEWVALRARSGDRASVLLVPLAVPQEPVYLAEGIAGRSLSWSPDGSALAFDLGETVFVWKRSGSEEQRLVRGLAHLAWVDPEKLWLLVSEGEQAHFVTWTLGE
ncbi:hypothetical protein OO015_06535 [Thermomicrobium sp. 4228-Ro]|uniref:hypothetical protein n=1 Tax=Thermomicrobium sp. 4228-Ro TaxID=2993937 RepID=UPI0022490947|nr:hypothetical protein [Thermomicrobium sp. 4228-Ro]MCX2727153.1 hypothetical protein [Thermomicrobium sp. 4228-Ro]